jgi:hypothetical protein
MLPILRTISVGGVFLAIMILGLALIPPGRSHMQFSAADAPARGALIGQHEHPEWRQFLLLAAIRRAEELDRLRALPDAAGLPEIPIVALDSMPAERPPAKPPTESKVAGLPIAHNETGSEDITGSTNVEPGATIPIDIGEASSSELPVTPPEEKPPVARSPLVDVPTNDAQASDPQDTVSPAPSKVAALAMPEQVRPVVVIRKRSVRNRASKPQAAAPAPAQIEAPPPFNLIQALFAALAGKPMPAAAPTVTKPAAGNQLRAKPKRQAAIRVGAQ